MLQWKLAKFLMSFSKPQVSFYSDFTWLFSVIKDNSSAPFLGQMLHNFLEMDQSKWKFSRIECSDWNSPNSCHFWNRKLVFPQTLHHSSVSWDKTPLYFFSCSSIYFQQKETIKIQIWWNFTWAVKSLKFCTLIGLLLSKSIKDPGK